MRSAPILWFAAVPLLLGAAPLYAQTILGELVEEDGDAPVAGAFVVLLDERGAEVDAFLSDSAGLFLLRAPAAGPYQLRVERIGHHPILTGALEFEADEQLGYRVEVPPRPLDLAALGTSAEPSCVGDPKDTFATALLWEEIRKALAITVWTGRLAPPRVQVTRYGRELEPTTQRIARQETSSWEQTGGQTFTGLTAPELAARGYVQAEPDGGYVYHGPDPRVLLSEEFREAHCFTVQAGESPLWLGLGFQPAAEGGPPDLKGVLWVNRATAELRRLEFRYTALPFNVPDAEPGGRIDFRRLTTGAWIIERWHIRMPVMLAGEDVRLLAILEEGAEATAVYGIDGTPLARAPQRALVGTVVDAAGGAPLAGAEVRLAGTSHADTTDALGRFRIERLLEGTYGVEVSLTDLEGLGIVPELRTVLVTGGGEISVQLDVLGQAAALAALCPEDERADGAAIVTGLVSDSLSGVPLPGAKVVARWSRVARASTDASGTYRFCSLPPDVPLTLEAEAAGRTGARVSLESPGPGRLLRRDLSVALVPEEGLVTRVMETGRGGPTRLVGQVLDAHTLRPVVDVDVHLEEAGLRTLTDYDGRFVFASVEPGYHKLVLDHLAYGARSDSVLLRGGEIVGLEVRLAMRPIELEPLTVVIQRRPLRPKMRGFYERLDRGWGDFITREEIESRRPFWISQLIGEIPGVHARPRAFSGYDIEMARGRCPPTIYLNGIRLLGYTSIDDVVHPMDVAGIEVYKSAIEVPGRFAGFDDRCGVIVVWTH
ncbi:MAG: carboxypeptidase regulatory-like domain-containing protein [Gemmatimonadota bacterium]|nr:MAG: carboxypeptidase regulatory-like domain-containing protein [Gemmatimonadota bacterium]